VLQAVAVDDSNSTRPPGVAGFEELPCLPGKPSKRSSQDHSCQHSSVPSQKQTYSQKGRPLLELGGPHVRSDLESLSYSHPPPTDGKASDFTTTNKERNIGDSRHMELLPTTVPARSAPDSPTEQAVISGRGEFYFYFFPFVFSSLRLCCLVPSTICLVRISCTSLTLPHDYSTFFYHFLFTS
jgi:hypothetical protein